MSMSPTKSVPQTQTRATSPTPLTPKTGSIDVIVSSTQAALEVSSDSMSPTKNVPPTQTRVTSPTPLAPKTGSRVVIDSTLEALEASNDSLQNRMFKLRLNTQSFDQEVSLFQQHYKDVRHPCMETWEADMLTRLIEVAHTILHAKLGVETCIHEGQEAEQRELVSRAYVNAAKRIDRSTLTNLGLGEGYYEALQRFPEVTNMMLS